MRARLLVDDAVGEQRRLLTTEDGLPFRLHLERWSERQKRARSDEIWLVRTVGRLAGGRAWRVALGSGPDGVLETSSRALHEGELVTVRIKAEARGAKGPVVSLHPLPAGAVTTRAPGRVEEAKSDPFLAGIELLGEERGSPARAEIDLAIELAAGRTAGVPGGGRLTIEMTTALTAVDVDMADREGASGETAIRDLNLHAAAETARQISLRGLAGLVVVDFVTMSSAADRRAIAETLRSRLRLYLARRCDVLEISPLGLCEASISRRMRGAAEALLDTPSGERASLDLLRRLESAGQAERGKRLRARICRAGLEWLERDEIGWRAALADRIGQRWTIEPAPADLRDEVWSE